MNQIGILVTGGTFDKEYNELEGRLFFKDTHVPEMLALGRSHTPVRIQKLMMIDSLDMVQKDRNKILMACARAKESRWVITHGTDTLEVTARFLGEESKGLLKGKTIILTGAMIPYKFGSSDGIFNLGGALAFAQALAPGVYVAMNGRYFDWNNVRKDRKSGRFVQIHA